MTNEEIKTTLQKLYDCEIEFTVIQTGKKSRKINGLYKPDTREILLHNKNFKNSNQIIYTAIHELTHHILTTEKEIKTVKSHNNLFWATFYDLVDVAIEKGIYKRERSENTKKLIEEAKAIQAEILEAQKKLGSILVALWDSCDENGERYEDVIESDLQLTKNKAKELRSMSINQSKYSDEMSKVIATAKDVMSAQKAAESGKTVEQVKAIAKKKPTVATDDDLDDPSSLIKEKKRLESTIERLQDRLVQVEETLASITSGE